MFSPLSCGYESVRPLTLWVRECSRPYPVGASVRSIYPEGASVRPIYPEGTSVRPIYPLDTREFAPLPSGHKSVRTHTLWAQESSPPYPVGTREFAPLPCGRERVRLLTMRAREFSPLPCVQKRVRPLTLCAGESSLPYPAGASVLPLTLRAGEYSPPYPVGTREQGIAALSRTLSARETREDRVTSRVCRGTGSSCPGDVFRTPLGQPRGSSCSDI